MRAADLCFAEQVRRASSSHRLTTSLVTGPKHTARIEAALMEMGIAFAESVKRDDPFGKELATRVQHVRGFSRSWCIERLPGTEIEAGWLFRLLPPGLPTRPSWHATPPPSPLVIGYPPRP